MKKLCLVVVSTLALTVGASTPAAAAAQHAPSTPSGVFCKLFPLLCR